MTSVVMQVLVGLQSSAEVTYNMGHWVVEYMGVSGSAFLAFFLIIKYGHCSNCLLSVLTFCVRFH